MTAHAMPGQRALPPSRHERYISKPVHPDHLLNVVDEYLAPKADLTASAVALPQNCG
jgi:CheY-like chemotaxis protein